MASRMQIKAQHQSSQASEVFKDLISEEEYADLRGVSLRTCRRDRQMRKGPPHIIVGRKVYYRLEAIAQWMLARETKFELVSRSPRKRHR